MFLFFELKINILTKMIGFRKNAHTDALNTISVLSDSFRTIVQTAESRSLNPITQIQVAKSDLIRWTELSESTRIKLEKTEVFLFLLFIISFFKTFKRK